MTGQPAAEFRRRAWLCIAAASAALAGTAQQARAQDVASKPCAVILMHGKWGSPQFIGHFGRRLEPYCAVNAIEMPWSQRRNYDIPYPQALKEVSAQVQALRAKGYQRVVVMGQSFGANAAMAYMAQEGDADAVVALAPGHVPAFTYSKGIGKEAVDKAGELVKAGQGSEKLAMEDFNQGKRQSIRMPADVLWSYFDPAGLGHMPRTAAAFKKPVPFLWVIGTNDPLYAAGEDFAYRKAPEHPASKYLVVTAGHIDTPDVAAAQVLDWLKSLP
jgi:dienelactone hydrolase